MINRFASYWQSKRANIHGLILFLGGSAGIAALQMMHVPESWAKAIAGGAMLLGALLYTPATKQ